MTLVSLTSCFDITWRHIKLIFYIFNRTFHLKLRKRLKVIHMCVAEGRISATYYNYTTLWPKPISSIHLGNLNITQRIPVQQHITTIHVLCYNKSATVCCSPIKILLVLPRNYIFTCCHTCNFSFSLIIWLFEWYWI